MTTPARNNDLAQIHMAKAKLGLADPDYRALLSERYGVLTAAALGPSQRQDLLAEFERRGWKRGWAGKRRAKSKGAYVAPRTKDSSQLAKIRAMLASANRPIAYGDELALRIAKVERLEWCSSEQLGKIIAALVYDAQRTAAKGVELPAELKRLVRERPALDRRVRSMFSGALRNPKDTPDGAVGWVLTTLRKEAEERAAEGGGQRPVEYRNDRQYARDMRAREEHAARRDREFMDALGLIGLIDRIRLEVRHAR